jgi:NhaP-type Na+/H+ or K+/H+ antiporter
MVEALTLVTYSAIILLLGFLASILAKKINVPSALFLIFLGLILGNLSFSGKPLMQFDMEFLSGVLILALVMIVFDKGSRFKIKEFDTFSYKTATFVIAFLALNIILISILAYFLFDFKNIYAVILFSIIISGIEFTLLNSFKHKAGKVIEALKVETSFNLPVVLLAPFLLLDIIIANNEIAGIFNQVLYVAQHFIIGIGIGIFLALIFFKFLKKYYSEKLFPLAIIVSAFLSYIMAENLQGNGVIAVATLGIFFGNMYLKGKPILEEFSELLFTALEILVFVLLGFMVKLNFSFLFFLKSILIFIAILIIRYISVLMAFTKDEFTQKERLFMTLNSPKGISVAVLTFAFLLEGIAGMDTAINLIFVIIIYSLVLTTITGIFSSSFLGDKK